MVAALENATTVSHLVDIVVQLRENRDGLVELPSHFRYVAKLSNIGVDTQYCPLTCRLFTSIINIRDSILYYEYNSFITSFGFGIISCLSMVLIMIILVHGYQLFFKLMPDFWQYPSVTDMSSGCSHPCDTLDGNGLGSTLDTSQSRADVKTTSNRVSLYHLSQLYVTQQQQQDQQRQQQEIRPHRYHRIPD